MSQAIRALEPKLLWNCFADLNAVPRPSKEEARVVQFMLDFAREHGLESVVDTGGNVIIRKPATQDRNSEPTLILQSHLDMVHKKAPDVAFDFKTQGIEMFVDTDGDTVRAKGTTLGADNGLGVAAIMAVLASTELSHPPLEALFTVDEEMGMTGAKNLQPGILQGKTLLNLDSEEDDTFTIGCAGGCDTIVSIPGGASYLRGGTNTQRITIKGLQGGHSGLAIHEGRGNAIKLMARILAPMDPEKVGLVSMNGGSARNAIPAECVAEVDFDQADQAYFESEFAQAVADITADYKHIEPKLEITVGPSPTSRRPASILTRPDAHLVLQALHAVVNGVFRMSPKVEGLVEASSNLSLISLDHYGGEISGLQRSSEESSKRDVATSFAAAFRALYPEEVTVRHSDGYPGWSPNADSPLLAKMRVIYADVFQEPVKVGACHAGLECGVIAETYPGLDMISFGPNIHGAHSEDERTSIASVAKFWKLLVAVLARL